MNEFWCRHCGFKSEKCMKFLQHTQIYHNLRKNFELKCRFCEKKFFNLKSFKTHVLSNHSIKTVNTKNDTILCSHCHDFFDEKGIKRHCIILLESGMNVKCPFCVRHIEFTSKNQFKSHCFRENSRNPGKSENISLKLISTTTQNFADLDEEPVNFE